MVSVGLLTACGSSSHPAPTPSATKKLGAAEPADSPTGTAAAAGTAPVLGRSPEGIVYDAQTATLVVAVEKPARLLLLDPNTLAVRATVALPGSVRHLQLAAPGGPVIVPVESANELLQVSLPGGVITATTPVGHQPHDASAVDGGLIVVGNEFSQSLSIIQNGVVVRTATGVKQPGGVIDAGSEAVVVDVGDFTVSTYDPQTGTRTAVLPAGAGPTHGVITAQREVVVADTRGNAVLTYSLDPLRAVGRLALPGTPYGMAVDASTDTVWVTLTALNQVVGLDVSGPNPRVIARYDTVEQPNTVAVEPGSHTIWITGSRHGEVERITR